jgi:MFS family permease
MGAMTTITRRYETLLVGIMFATWGTVFLDRMAQLYLAPFIMPALHLDNRQIGLVTSVTAVTWGISSLAFGVVSDRIGRRRILIPAVLFFSILSCLSGLAQDFTQLLIIRALMGVAEGPCWSVINAIVEQSSPPTRKGRNVGIVVCAAALIGLAAAPVLTTQVAAIHGWRAAFIVAGLPGFALTALIWRFVKEPPASMAGDPAARAAPAWKDFRLLLLNRNILLCCVAATGFISWLMVQNLFASLYMVRVQHLSETRAGFLMGIAGLGSLTLGLASTSISDRLGRKPVLLALTALSSLLPLAVLTTPLYDNLPLLATILFLTHGGQGIAALIMVLIPTESVPARLAASAIGLVNLCGELIGGTLAPAFAGALAQSYGLAIPLIIASGSMGLVFLAGLLISRDAMTAGPASPASVALGR